MSIPLTINNTTFDYPETGNQKWGPDATEWAQAVTVGMLQKAGGLFQLLDEVDFGTSYGLKSLYLKSRATNPASAGQIRLGNAETVSWRDSLNTSDLALRVNSSDRLQFNSVNLITASSTDTLTNKTIDATNNTLTNISNSNIASNAAIAFSKLASLTSGNIIVGSSGNVATSVSMSGDITISDLGVTAIGANKVTNAMLAQVATATFKGRTTASTGDVEDLTATQATALLNNVVGDSGSGGTKGLVPAPQAGDAAANKFLKADGTWVAPAGAGDVVGPASSVDGTIARFDGLTGKLLKNSPTTISNSDVDASAGIALNKLAATTASRALVSDGSGFITPAATTATEIGYVNGVTSAIQTQLDAKQVRSTLTTKGDIYAATASATTTRVPVGINAQALVADSSTSTGLNYGSVFYKNYCLNGDFAISQRNSTFTLSGSNQYIMDRWICQLGSGSSFTASQQSISSDPASTCLRIQRTAGQTSTAATYLGQSFESSLSRGLVGKYVTVSFRIRKGANWTPASIDAVLYSGTGTNQQDPRSYTSSTSIGSLNIPTASISSSFTTFSFTTSAVIASSVTQLGVSFVGAASSGTAGAADYYEITQVMVNEGTVAAPFQLFTGGDFGTELRECMRFYEKSYDLTTYPGVSANNGRITVVRGTGSGAFTVVFKVPKRTASPTVTTYSPVNGTSGKAYNANTSADVTTTANTGGQMNLEMALASGSPGDAFLFHFTADAEF